MPGTLIKVAGTIWLGWPTSSPNGGSPIPPASPRPTSTPTNATSSTTEAQRHAPCRFAPRPSASSRSKGSSPGWPAAADLPYDPRRHVGAAQAPSTACPKSSPLSVEEVESVLACPDTTTALGIRDRAMMEVFYSRPSGAWS